MTRCWLALIAAPAAGATVQAEVRDADGGARRLARRVATAGEAGPRRAPRRRPFARIFPARILRVGGGVLGAVPAPAGPSIERYGSANPWPWDHFDLSGGS